MAKSDEACEDGVVPLPCACMLVAVLHGGMVGLQAPAVARIVFLVFLLFAEPQWHAVDPKPTFDHFDPSSGGTGLLQAATLWPLCILTNSLRGRNCGADSGGSGHHEGICQSAPCLCCIALLRTEGCFVTLRCPDLRYGLGAVGFCLMITCLGIQWSMMLESLLQQRALRISLNSVSRPGSNSTCIFGAYGFWLLKESVSMWHQVGMFRSCNCTCVVWCFGWQGPHCHRNVLQSGT